MLLIRNRLGRIITRGRRFIAEVDGLRFVAIMAVVFFHLGGYTTDKHMAGASVGAGEAWLPRVLHLGHYGVQLFFVLSGFLLAMPFAKWRLGLGSKPSLKYYYLRRLTRLEPPYIVSMILLFIGGFIAVGYVTASSRWPNFLASLVYQHNLVYGEGSLINPPAWSLEVEVQFYLLAPFLAVVYSLRRHLVRRATLVGVMLAAPLLRGFVPPDVIERYGLCLPGFIEFFVAGFLLADLFLVDWKESPVHAWRWDVLSIAAWPLLLWLMLSERLPVLIAPVVLVAYVGAFRGRFSSWLFRQPLLTVIGGMCYSMYLLHYAVISVTGRFAQRFLVGSSFTSRLAVEALFGLPAILAATLLFFVILERPCMDPAWPSKLARRLGWRSRSGEERIDLPSSSR